MASSASFLVALVTILSTISSGASEMTGTINSSRKLTTYGDDSCSTESLAQCGGRGGPGGRHDKSGHDGLHKPKTGQWTCCPSEHTCIRRTKWYWQCVIKSGSESPSPQISNRITNNANRRMGPSATLPAADPAPAPIPAAEPVLTMALVADPVPSPVPVADPVPSPVPVPEPVPSPVPVDDPVPSPVPVPEPVPSPVPSPVPVADPVPVPAPVQTLATTQSSGPIPFSDDCTQVRPDFAAKSHWCTKPDGSPVPMLSGTVPRQDIYLGRQTTYSGPVLKQLGYCNKTLQGYPDRAAIAISTKWLALNGEWKFGTDPECGRCACLKILGNDQYWNSQPPAGYEKYIGKIFKGEVMDMCPECSSYAVDVLADQPYSRALPSTDGSNPFAADADARAANVAPIFTDGMASAVGVWNIHWGWLPDCSATCDSAFFG